LLAALTVSAAVLLIVVALVWWLDRYDREPLHLVAMVFLWGASAAPLVAVMVLPTLERLLHRVEGFQSMSWISVGILTPLIEESAKAVGVLLVVVFSSKFDNPTDGVVYGTAVGLGFAVTENVIYGISAGVHLFNVTGILILVGGRTLLSAGVHGAERKTVGESGMDDDRVGGRGHPSWMLEPRVDVARPGGRGWLPPPLVVRHAGPLPDLRDRSRPLPSLRATNSETTTRR
jgi:RsiW-degrading membrane proteinase PrsW (M82 family)